MPEQSGAKNLTEQQKINLEKGHSPEAIAKRKAIMQSEEYREKMRQALSGERNPNYKKNFSEQTRRKMSEAKSGCTPWIKGRKHSLESRNKMSLAHKGKNLSHEHVENARLARLGYSHSEETKEKISLSNKGKKRSPEFCELARENRLKRKFPTKMTSIERSLCEKFTEVGLTFEMHKTMFGRFQPDFVFEDAKLIVQADGDYWHSLPRNKKYDDAFAEHIKNSEWSVMRFSETDIKRDVSKCVSDVIQFIHRLGN